MGFPTPQYSASATGRFMMYQGNIPVIVDAGTALDAAGATAVGKALLMAADAAAARDAISAFGVVRMQKFTASGTYTPDPNLVYAVVEAVGAGGAGGGAETIVGHLNGGGGGGSGSYARSVLSASTIGPSQTVTVGAGGAGANNANGGSGGDSSFGSLCIGKGGAGGTRGTASSIIGSGGAGGIAGAGDLTIVGGRGFGSNFATITTVMSQPGNGGPSFFTPGAPRPIVSFNSVANGQNGTGYGGGGSGGGAHNTTSTSSGGNGAPGFVLVTEFCSQ